MWVSADSDLPSGSPGWISNCLLYVLIQHFGELKRVSLNEEPGNEYGDPRKGQGFDYGAYETIRSDVCFLVGLLGLLLPTAISKSICKLLKL